MFGPIRPHQTVFGPLQEIHGDILNKADELYAAVSGLQCEGKISLERNLLKIQRVMDFLKEKLLPHIELDEEVVFPFLERHIPKLDPMLRFLRSEHSEIRSNLAELEVLISKMRQQRAAVRRNRIITQIKEQGTYLYCLMRNHIQTETESVYKELNKRLDTGEKKKLLEEYTAQKKTRNSRPGKE